MSSNKDHLSSTYASLSTSATSQNTGGPGQGLSNTLNTSTDGPLTTTFGIFSDAGNLNNSNLNSSWQNNDSLQQDQKLNDNQNDQEIQEIQKNQESVQNQQVNEVQENVNQELNQEEAAGDPLHDAGPQDSELDPPQQQQQSLGVAETDTILDPHNLDSTISKPNNNFTPLSKGLPSVKDEESGVTTMKLNLTIVKGKEGSRIISEVSARSLTKEDKKLLDNAVRMTVDQWRGKVAEDMLAQRSGPTDSQSETEDPMTELTLAVNETGGLQELRLGLRPNKSKIIKGNNINSKNPNEMQQFIIDRANTPQFDEYGYPEGSDVMAIRLQAKIRGNQARKMVGTLRKEKRLQDAKIERERQERLRRILEEIKLLLNYNLLRLRRIREEIKLLLNYKFLPRLRRIREEKAVVLMQSYYRGIRSRNQTRQELDKKEKAASHIQANWRGMKHRGVVQELKDLQIRKWKREAKKATRKQKVKKIVYVDIHHVHHHHHFHQHQVSNEVEQNRELEDQARQLTSTTYVENRIESVYQGTYKKFIVDKVDPPFMSPQHYHSHLASLDAKERLGYSPYIYTSDSRITAQRAKKPTTNFTPGGGGGTFPGRMKNISRGEGVL